MANEPVQLEWFRPVRGTHLVHLRRVGAGPRTAALCGFRTRGQTEVLAPPFAHLRCDGDDSCLAYAWLGVLPRVHSDAKLANVTRRWPSGTGGCIDGKPVSATTLVFISGPAFEEREEIYLPCYGAGYPQIAAQRFVELTADQSRSVLTADVRRARELVTPLLGMSCRPGETNFSRRATAHLVDIDDALKAEGTPLAWSLRDLSNLYARAMKTHFDKVGETYAG